MRLLFTVTKIRTDQQLHPSSFESAKVRLTIIIDENPFITVRPAVRRQSERRTVDGETSGRARGLESLDVSVDLAPDLCVPQWVIDRISYLRPGLRS